MFLAGIHLISNPPTVRTPPVSSRYTQQHKTGPRFRLAIRMSAQGAWGCQYAFARPCGPNHLRSPASPSILILLDPLRSGKGGTAEQNGGSELPLHYTPDGRLPKPTKLSLVVTDAVRRWYLETEREAERNDVVSCCPAALVPHRHATVNSQMLTFHLFFRRKPRLCWGRCS